MVGNMGLPEIWKLLGDMVPNSGVSACSHFLYSLLAYGCSVNWLDFGVRIGAEC